MEESGEDKTGGFISKIKNVFSRGNNPSSEGSITAQSSQHQINKPGWLKHEGQRDQHASDVIGLSQSVRSGKGIPTVEGQTPDPRPNLVAHAQDRTTPDRGTLQNEQGYRIENPQSRHS